jgi:hypothetical protein
MKFLTNCIKRRKAKKLSKEILKKCRLIEPEFLSWYHRHTCRNMIRLNRIINGNHPFKREIKNLEHYNIIEYDSILILSGNIVKDDKNDLYLSQD